MAESPELELVVTALAAGGDGVARDAGGRVTFVPRTAPGDRVRARVVHATSSFARAELVEVLEPAASREQPPCVHFVRGCGGCQWQHVRRGEQLAAKQAIVAGALRKLPGLTVHKIAEPAPPLHWRRRARFHVDGGRTGLYVLGTKRVLPLERARRVDLPEGPAILCPQLEPALDAALCTVAGATPPDGELGLVLAHDGKIAVGVERAWRGAPRLVGKSGIVGIIAGKETHGEVVLELEPGLWGGPWEFAQASALGNAALVAKVRELVGAGPGTLVELYAGAGNFTRGLLAAGWTVIATDLVAPARPLSGGGGTRFEVGPVADVVAKLAAPVDVVVLDPPRAGAAEAIDGIVRLAPRTIVYVSCDPATLARDAGRLVAAGYEATDAWPYDLMPQTSHVEVVMVLRASARAAARTSS
ncbi:MAG TPA: TRAM domain-containing protein [Kofleriaceae bacterium]|nr:TRAM domain-containing protein [Kofleriaceae bacterium]